MIKFIHWHNTNIPYNVCGCTFFILVFTVDPSIEPILSEVPPIRLSYHGASFLFPSSTLTSSNYVSFNFIFTARVVCSGGNHYNSLMALSAPPPLSRRSSTLIRSARVLANGGGDHAEMLQAKKELAQARWTMDNGECFPIAEVIGHSRI
jgi:hypothetical protein